MADLRVPDLNVVFIAGRLTRDPDLKYTVNNRAYCRFGIANTRYYRTKDGNRGEDTVFINCSCWDRQAEWIGDRIKKGRPVLVEGSLRSYEAEDRNTGQKTTRVEINARRITPLDWDDQGPGGGTTYGAAAGGAVGGGYGAPGGGYNQPAGNPPGGGAAPGGAQPGPQGGASQYQDQSGHDEPIPEDDIPF